MKKITRLLTVTSLIGAFALVAISPPAHAEEETETKPAVWVQVAPTHKTLTLDPGDNYTSEFTVSNIGSEAFSFKAYASPFSVVGEDYRHDYYSDTNYNQIYRWVTFDQSEYSLAVGESATVTFHVNVPEDVAGGSQHAVLFAESEGKSSGATEGITAISRVGMRLAARISGETRDAVEITEYKMPRVHASFEASNVTATSKVKNIGNTDVEARFHFQVDPLFGGEPLHVEDRTHLIYPDSEYRHNVEWENTPLLGLFKVTYNVSAHQEAREGQFLVLVIPTWLIIIFIILLTALIIWIILKVKKRRQLRSRIQF